MKFWIGPIGGALIAGAYGTLRLSEEWNIGGEHAFRASGTLLAYMLVGSFIGLVVSGLVFAATQDDDPVPEPMPGDVRRVLMERSRPMSHPVRDKTKVLDRMQHIQTQIGAIQRSLDAELGCIELLRMLSDVRSTLNDLSAELVEDSIRTHVDARQGGTTDRAQAAQQLIDAVRSYAKAK